MLGPGAGGAAGAMALATSVSVKLDSRTDTMRRSSESKPPACAVDAAAATPSKCSRAYSAQALPS